MEMWYGMQRFETVRLRVLVGLSRVYVTDQLAILFVLC